MNGGSFLVWVLAAASASPAGERPPPCLFPGGAALYLHCEHPGKTFRYDQNYLRDAGQFGLAAGLEDLYYREQTEDARPQFPFDIWSFLLQDEKLPALQGYLRGMEDWGRGRTPDDTRRAAQAVREGELAVYPGGGVLQALHGDAAAWLAVVRKKGPVVPAGAEGKIPIEKIDEGERAWFAAAVRGAVLRSPDLDLLRQALAWCSRADRRGGLDESPLYKELWAASRESTSTKFFVDAPLLLDEILGVESVSASLGPWLRAATQGIDGFVQHYDFEAERVQIRARLISKRDAPLTALLGGPLSDSFLKGIVEKPLFLAAARLEPGAAWKAFVSGFPANHPASIFLQAWNGFAQNLDGDRMGLAVDIDEEWAFALGVKDPASLGSHLSTFLGILGASGKGFEISREGEAEEEFYEIRREGEDGREEFRLLAGRRGRFLLLASSSSAWKSLPDPARLWPPSGRSSSPVAEEGPWLVADASALGRLPTGDLSFQVHLIPGPTRPLLCLRFDAGLDPEASKRALLIDETLRQKRPKLHAKLTAGLGTRERLPSGAEAIFHDDPGNLFALAFEPDRLRLLIALDTFAEWTPSVEALGLSDRKQALRAELLRGQDGARTALRDLPEKSSLAVLFDLTPLFEEMVRTPALFSGFIHTVLSVSGWPWFTLETRQWIAAVSGSGGLDFACGANVRPLQTQAVAHFLDEYPPSDSERRAIGKAMAIEQAQRLFARAARKDANRNGVGEFGAVPDLVEFLAAADPGGAPLFAAAGEVSSGEFVEGGYRYRLLLPDDEDDRERRWCLFAVPQPADFDRRLIFYVDERGVLLAGIQVLASQLAQEIQLLEIAGNAFKAGRVVEFASRPKPPDHAALYEFFLPLMTAYGARLQPASY